MRNNKYSPEQLAQSCGGPRGARRSSISAAISKRERTRAAPVAGAVWRPLSVPIEYCTELPIEIAHLGLLLSV
jgi:hypothetical protein